jgi:EAL domain-containing protein (putative c-di-GMP-specific phosphodiesterase class I)/GGDEF domain-containing protein
MNGESDFMFNYTSDLIFRPKRTLLYVEAGDNDALLGSLMDGELPEAFVPYNFDYGVYDYAGMFFTGEEKKENISVGIELFESREYELKEGMKVIRLPESEMLKVEVDRAQITSISGILDFINMARKAKPVLERNYSFAEGMSSEIFFDEKKVRVFIPIISEYNEITIDKSNYENFSKEELFNAAYIDKVTGLYTWNWLSNRFRKNLLNKEGIKRFCFVHFDIKDFKTINREFTPYEGNMLLCRIADTIKINPNVYYIVRCYEDNFAMIIKDMPDEELNNFLVNLFAGLSVFEISERFPVYYRVGVVRSRDALNAGVKAMGMAKLAQKIGKKINETEINYYSSDLQKNYLWGHHIRLYIDTAIANDEFLIYYQPKVSIKTEQIVGAEALVRWNYKRSEIIFPDSFIPYFERDNSIAKLSDVVLVKVCEYMAKLKEQGIPLIPVSVNISRKLMTQAYLADHLEDIVDEYGIEHKYIEFELTESATYEKSDYLLRVIRQLKQKGFLISMDDFGTGYSSFGLLMNMQIDTLKIDKMFVNHIAENNRREREYIIVKHFIAMSKELGFTCLAEGAEEKEQIEELGRLGCDLVQGYYYSKPVPEDEFIKKLKN